MIGSATQSKILQLINDQLICFQRANTMHLLSNNRHVFHVQKMSQRNAIHMSYQFFFWHIQIFLHGLLLRQNTIEKFISTPSTIASCPQSEYFAAFQSIHVQQRLRHLQFFKCEGCGMSFALLSLTCDDSVVFLIFGERRDICSIIFGRFEGNILSSLSSVSRL